MKKASLVIGLLIAGILLGVVVGLRFALQARRTDSIVSVLNQNKAKAAPLQGKKEAPLMREFRAYAKEIDKIDASACPTDFRLAWFDYVQCVHRTANAGLFEAAAFAVKTAGAIYLHDSKMAEEAERQLHQTDVGGHYVRLQRIAIKYGVSFTPMK
jgi:hypothetical protein